MREIEYKNFRGTVEFSEEDGLFFGKVKDIRALISYQGKTPQELIHDFHGAIDDYLETCAAEGLEPEKGQYFNKQLSCGAQIITVAEATQNFSKATCIADEKGSVLIFKNNRPIYKLTNLEVESDLELTDDEKIDVVARRIMARFKSAFLELAK